MCGNNSHYAHALFIFIAILMTLVSQNSYAGSNEKISSPVSEKQLPATLDLCPVKNFTATRYIKPRAFSKKNIDNTDISADFTESSSDGMISLDGNVIIEQNEIRITADHADYNKQNNEIRFSGDVHIDTEDISLDTDEGKINMSEKSTTDPSKGTFYNNTFFLPDSKMKGRAEKIISSDQTDDDPPTKIKHTILYNASITSCNLIDPDWLLTADEIYLDHDDEQGTAEDAVMRFKGVPFLYTPYLRFPTSDKRRSGFLFPVIGASTTSGADLAVPWYWNIAPNQDAVLTPHYMAKRGLELGADYRYLTQSTTGELVGGYLPNDNVTHDDRYQYRYQQHSLIMSNLAFDADIQNVSDLNYFNDFSNSLNTTSQTHLNRSAALNYDLSNWHMRALLQDIKTIDASIAISDRPYERLPQLTLAGNTEIPQTPLQFTMESEYVDFEHQDDTNITGSRLTLTPGLHLPLNGAAWFIDPAVKFSHTQYNVGTDGNATTPGTTVELDDRNLPISSVDAGLFFERPLSNGYQQTLEPRLFYLYVPYENQTNVPLFDTSYPDFTVAQLFRDNRFIGGDRIGDTNQLTLSLTSRIIDPNTGTEFLRASIGQILYFEDRKVALSGNSVETRRQSDIVAALNTKWQSWQIDVNLQWDSLNNTLSQDDYFLHYQSDARHLFNIGYRRRLNDNSIDIEQIDTSFVYAINKNYTGIARWNYSLKEDKGLDTIAGFTYDSCCWSIQLLAQRRIQNTSTSTSSESAYENSILLQFVFKGLGSLSGSKTRSTLEQSIHGYTDVFH